MWKNKYKNNDSLKTRLNSSRNWNSTKV